MFDRTITILRKSGAIIRHRSACIQSVKSEEWLSDLQIAAADQIDVRIRYSRDVANVSPPDRIAYAPDEDAPTVFDILVVQTLGRREGLRIVAERRQDIAPWRFFCGTTEQR